MAQQHESTPTNDESIETMALQMAQEMADLEEEHRLGAIATEQQMADLYIKRLKARVAAERMVAHTSYEEIGKVLGVSRQAAWERFSASAASITPPAAE